MSAILLKIREIASLITQASILIPEICFDQKGINTTPGRIPKPEAM